MNRSGGFSLIGSLIGAGLVGACAAAPPGSAGGRAAAEPLRVTNGAAPFANFEGVAARKMAEGQCGERGQRLQSSIYDRYEAGAWVFVEGCA